MVGAVGIKDEEKKKQKINENIVYCLCLDTHIKCKHAKRNILNVPTW